MIIKNLLVKYQFSILLFLFCLILFLGNAASQDISHIDEIKIATPKWEAQTNEDGTGLFFEIVKRVYEPLGIKMTYTFVPWKRAQALVNHQDNDAMLCVWEEHAVQENQILPRYPLFVEFTAVIFKKGKFPSWKGIQSLNGKSAVWLRGYDYHLFKPFESIKLNKYHEVDSYDKAWLQLNLGRYDVYIDALIDLDIYIKKSKIDVSAYNKEILWGEKAYVAFSQSEKSKGLVQLYDERIQILFKTGDLEKIYKKWGVKFHPEYWKN